MSSTYAGAVEHYYSFPGDRPWSEFVEACLAPMPRVPGVFHPEPGRVAGSFCVSAQCRDGIVEAVTVLADERSLPDDETICREWSRDMPPDEAAQYELVYAAVRSCGIRRRGSWHAMLAWTLDRNGEWRRAVSFRLPATAEVNRAPARQ